MVLIREQVFFHTRNDLRLWLAQHHTRTEGIWAVFYKKTTGLGDLSWEAIVEECLCVGWIDSLPGTVDDTKTKIYISPRKPYSGWSKRNKVLLVALEANGMLTDAGRDAIHRAKANGSWQRFDRAEALIIPQELSDCFVHESHFRLQWERLSDAKKRQFLQQIYDAKTATTRTKKIETIRKALGADDSSASV
ncbi:MAG: hypothetical protein FJ040_10535 [Chloroflexi bacterium]|nr:hypothetical protein [Chloroflexota bacterium]